MQKLEDFEPKKIPGGLCGVDEAGRGPVMGPMVVAGVLVDEDSELRRIGVREGRSWRNCSNRLMQSGTRSGGGGIKSAFPGLVPPIQF